MHGSLAGNGMLAGEGMRLRPVQFSVQLACSKRQCLHPLHNEQRHIALAPWSPGPLTHARG